jgi:acyl-CoA reductase-like NAD-dependent aldehyde dehydrogenase
MATDVPLVDAAQLLGELRRTFSSGRTKSEKWRSQQLRALLKMVTEQEKEICKALTLDLGKSEYETYACEVIILLRPGKEGGREGLKQRQRKSRVCVFVGFSFLSFFFQPAIQKLEMNPEGNCGGE